MAGPYGCWNDSHVGLSVPSLLGRAPIPVRSSSPVGRTISMPQWLAK